MNHDQMTSDARRSHLMLLGGQSHGELAMAADVMGMVAGYLTAESLPDLCRAQAGRAGGQPCRGYVVSDSWEGMADQLARRRDRWTTVSGQLRPIVMVFPGYEVPHRQMLANLSQIDSGMGRFVEACDRAARHVGLTGLLDDDDNEPNRHVRSLAAQICFADAWIRAGLRPDAMVGHSLGEYAAAVMARVMSLPDAFRLVQARAIALREMSSRYRMLSVDAEQTVVDEILARDDLEACPAAYNAPGLTTVSAPVSKCAELSALVAERGGSVTPIAVSGAGHRPEFAPRLGEFVRIAAATPLHQPVCRVVSTVCPDRDPGQLADPRHWLRQACQPVRFADALARCPARGYVSAGFTPGIISVVQRNPADASLGGRVLVPSIQSGRSYRRQFLRAVGQAFEHGVEVDINCLEE